MPLKLIPPNERSPFYTVRGTHLARTPYARYVETGLGTNERGVAQQALAKIKRDIESGAFSPQRREPAERTFFQAALDYQRAGGDGRFLPRLSIHFDKTPLSKINQAAVDEAAEALYPNSPAPTRNRQVYTPVSAVLKREKIRLGLQRPKGARSAPRLHWLHPDQLFALLDAAEDVDARFGALLTFLAYCGPRLSEALRLEWADVDLNASHAYLRQTKNGEPQAVHLPPVVVASLANMPRPSPKGGRVFLGMSKCARLYQMLDMSSVASGVVIPDGIAFHIFRHTYGALLRRHAGMDTAGLVATGRWKSRQAAAVYEHVETSVEAKRADLLPTRTAVRK